MKKKEIATIAEKNRIASNIIGEIERLDTFILVGHQDPDVDCIASLAAVGLLLCRAGKDTVIYLPGPVGEHFNYLLAICKYNGIIFLYGGDEIPTFLDKEDAGAKGLFLLDTPKPEMFSWNGPIKKMFKDPAVRKIEIDHHVQTDAVYAGDQGFCLVTEASSTCELVGYLVIKMAKKKNWRKKDDIFTQNVSLAILTGIVGDSSMGKYLKNKREKRYYDLFSNSFDRYLEERTQKPVKKTSTEAAFDPLQSFSVQDKKCFDRIMGATVEAGALFYVGLDEAESKGLFDSYGNDRMVMVTKIVADILAENSGKLGLVAYYDTSKPDGLVQFRLRRGSKYNTLDLRKVLKKLNLDDGGGHPGAIGFRIPGGKIAGFDKFIAELAEDINALVEAGNKEK
ncbi:MAG: DHH family phosphoesterase [Spirochaetaceae bacterium]|jgi:nanoRNase/pAp phosphatase (c-di-AMP/oligoRNAs hydrolase)|nr:DHH family phosphoesterase [Spirochaetaceae bacterium]